MRVYIVTVNSMLTVVNEQGQQGRLMRNTCSGFQILSEREGQP